jgi:hypothetical protein
MDLNKNSGPPKLIEPGTRYFLNASLNRCNEIKNKYYNQIFNISVFKGRLSKYEMEIKETQKKEYIMSKIKNYQDTRRKERQQMITNLPKW